MTKPIIALDFPTEKKTIEFLSQFQEEALFVKVGMELFYQSGYHLLDRISQMGHAIFLDLKLHDIPNTVERAMAGLAQFPIQLVNVHASGGSDMMKAALYGLEKGSQTLRPKLIAVTQLTSADPLQAKKEQQLGVSLEESVLNYAQLAKECGLDGVVCSVLEAKKIEEVCGKEFLKVTPGIRLECAKVDDQVRIATPNLARKEGSTHIVVGRPITQSDDPVAQYHLVKTLWENNK